MSEETKKSPSSMETFQEYTKRMIQIYNLSKNENIREYLKLIEELKAQRRLAFVMQGNVQWKAKKADGISAHGIWLRSNLYDPIGKHIMDNPVKNYLQTYQNTYEICGTVDGIFNSADKNLAKSEIETALKRITILRNAFSFLFGISTTWYPARYLEVKAVASSLPPAKEDKKEWRFCQIPLSSEERTSTILEDEHVESVLQATHHIEHLDERIGATINTALDWHSEGNRHGSGLSRFVNHWASIEVIGHFFYAELKADIVGRRSKQQKKDEVNKILNNRSNTTILDRITQCNAIVYPPIREKLRSVFALLPDSSAWETELFGRDDSDKSLYQLRNDIAHGKVSEHHFESIATMKERLWDMYQISRKVLFSTIENVDRLLKNFD